jgi:hypothetical protein
MPVQQEARKTNPALRLRGQVLRLDRRGPDRPDLIDAGVDGREECGFWRSLRRGFMSHAQTADSQGRGGQGQPLED